MVASVVRRIVKSRTPKGKRADVRASSPRAKTALERRERQLTKKRAETSITPARKTSKPKIPKTPKIPPGTPVPKPPTTKGGARRVLKKFGVPGAVITGVLGVAGNKAIRDNKKTKVAAKPAAKPTRRRGPSGPTMTSVGRPSTGPKPRNKDRRVKPRRPSGPSMTGFRR